MIGISVFLFSTGALAVSRSEFLIQGDLIGASESYVVQKEDTLYDLARTFKVGLVELMAANPGVDAWVPEPQSIIVIPAGHVLPVEPSLRRGIVINLPELRLYYFSGDGRVFTYPLGIGREGWQTPLGTTSITAKRKDPVWVPPPSIRAENPGLPVQIPAGPDNPLGAYAMNLGWPHYTIHGTDKPDGIGMRSSHGCIRMYPEDIEELFALVKQGTPVRVVDRPYKLGTSNAELYLEASPTQEQTDVLLDEGAVPELDVNEKMVALNQQLYAWKKAHGREIDWDLAARTLHARKGVPVKISKLMGQESQSEPAAKVPSVEATEMSPMEETVYPLPKQVDRLGSSPAIAYPASVIAPPEQSTEKQIIQPFLPEALRERNWRPIPEKE